MGESGSVDAQAITPLEYLDKLFEFGLFLGMSYDDYWNKEPELFLRYYNAEKLKQQKKNNEMWLQGAYIDNAVGSLYPIFNPFSKEKKARPYMSSPIPLTEEEKQKQFEDKVTNYLDKLVGLKLKQ